MKVFLKFFLICCFSLPLTACAAELPWEFAGWYGGGCFPNIAFDPQVKGRVYLTSDVAGIYRSDYSGDHWYFLTKGLGNLVVAQVAIAPSDFNVLYAATKGGLFVSLNAGTSWSAADNAAGAITFERPANYRSVAVNAKDATKLCVGTSKGSVFCSDDRGAHWRNVDPNNLFFSEKKPVTALAYDAQGRLYAAASTGLIRCKTDGSGCENLQGPKGSTDFVLSKKSEGTIYAAGEAQLWISVDAGTSWQRSQSVPSGKTYRIALDESGNTPVLRVAWNDGWKGGVVSSFDLGQSWSQGNGVMNGDTLADPSRIWADKNGKLTGLFIDPFDPKVLFRTDWWGVWRSNDGGATWQEKIVGAPNTVGTQAAFSSNGDLYVASMDNGLLRSRDAGKTYEMLFPTKYDPARSGHVWRVAMAGDTVIGTSSPWNEPVNQVILSSDGGKTFELIRQGFPTARPKVNTMWGQGYPRGLAVDPKNPDIIYMGIDGDDGGGLFVSRDRGRSWKRSAGQPGALRIYNALAVDPTDSRRIVWGACNTNGGIYISEDGGQTFNYAFKGMQWVFDVKISSDGTIFAAGDSGGAKLYMSLDHGRTWKLSGDFGKGRALGSVAVDPLNPKRVAVSTVSWSSSAPCKISLSEDGGITWRDVTGDLPDGAGASSLTFDPQSKYLYITRYAGSVYRLKF